MQRQEYSRIPIDSRGICGCILQCMQQSLIVADGIQCHIKRKQAV